MSRILNFRGWDGERMYYMDDIPGNPWRKGLVSPVAAFWEYICRLEVDVEIMESTGLKDKIGKEIYEGDIVKWVFDNVKYTSDVSFNRGMFCIDPMDNKEYYLLEAYLHQDMEVIGNRFEHPELLEHGK